MSRIGKLPIAVPDKVTVSIGDNITVKGPKGELSRPIVAGVSVVLEDNVLQVNRDSDHRTHRANHGLMRALLNNMVTGVTKGFEKKLEIIGVGYKAEMKSQTLVMNLGFSHLVEYVPPKGVSITVDKNTKLTISGSDKEAVGQTAAVIRGFRPPDAYKGKGVRYENEVVRLKAGKAAKK